MKKRNDDALSGRDGGRGNDNLNGNSRDDSIHGGAGHDVINGNGGDDDLDGGVGDDVLKGGLGDDALSGGLGNDRLFGGSGRDRLAGGAGDDQMNGGSGRDHMEGGKGNDVYVIDSAHEITKTLGDAGTDRVVSSVSYGLGAHQERLVLSGVGNTNGTGNSGDDIVSGNRGNNHLRAC